MPIQIKRIESWAPAPQILLEQQPNRSVAQLFVITDPSTGFSVHITDFGATIVEIQVPDKTNKLTQVAYGQNTPEEFIKNEGYLGASVGRVANRIAKGKFELDGESYTLATNNGPNSLHGGVHGFDKRWWNVKRFETVKIVTDEHEETDAAVLEFEYVSQDGEEGYPGALSVTLRYIVSSLKIGWEFYAHTTNGKKTIINLTNHTYWNIDQLFTTIDNIQLTLNATSYMPVDNDCLVTGEVVPLESSPFGDLSKNPLLFKDIFERFGDVDHNFILNNRDPKKLITTPNVPQARSLSTKELSFVAKLYSDKSGINMEVYSNQPCVQIYTGNFMKPEMLSFGKSCMKHGAVCLETQVPPNSINIPEFKNAVVLHPEQIYYHKTVHKFSA